MPSQQDQSPFTFVLSNVLLVMLAIFLVSNIALITILPFWDAFYGDFDFSKSSPLSHFNVVHVSDVDLYRLSILLAGLLLFFILPLIVCARNIVLKSWGGREPSSPPGLSA